MCTDLEITALAGMCKDAKTHSYSPYSKFRVGAALLLKNGDIITGTQQYT